MRVVTAIVAALSVSALWRAVDRVIPHAVDLPIVHANDNRRAAGSRHGDTVVVRLAMKMARWYPEDSGGVHADVYALSDASRDESAPPQIPAPLMRVPSGTVLDVTVRNTRADTAIWVFGLHERPMKDFDSTRVGPNDSLRVLFRAGAPGTYAYGAWPEKVQRQRFEERETAWGAFVVDPPGGSPPDRVLVINIWGEAIDSLTTSNALTINGKSWPYDEKIAATVGDTLRWRVVNGSMRTHPMHLHGFYFNVDAEGDGVSDYVYAKRARPKLVTRTMPPIGTMSMSWIAGRPGNWLFHCHIGFHVTPEAARLDQSPTTHLGMEHDATKHMAGLVLGIEVKPRTTFAVASRAHATAMRLLVQERPSMHRAKTTMSFVLDDTASGVTRFVGGVPGTPLLLHVGEPTDITVVNTMKEATAIHWHGIELESYSDGVSGWSGAMGRLAPVVAPRDSFVAHLTLPRAGTFIYHTHLNDIKQLTSGLYGGIVVLPKGQRFDATADHLFVTGWDGEQDPPHVLVNGDSIGRPLDIALGARHRFRFANIGVAVEIVPHVMRESAPVQWFLTARDGAELPTPRALVPASEISIDVGETADFLWRPTTPGRYRLVIIPGLFEVPLIVR